MDEHHELRAVRAVEEEMTRRSLRSTNVDVINYKPSSVIPASQLAPTGTIAVYVSRRGSQLLKEIREAAKKPDRGRDRALARRVIRTARAGHRQPGTDGERARHAAPAH